VATVKDVYADPSALLKLYLNEPQSRAMATWRAKHSPALAVTHHGRVELINGIGLAVHRGYITEPTSVAAFAALDDDFAHGRYTQADLLWRAALKRAGDISRRHTPKLGCRSLDVLHVASALELNIKYFVTFDARQQNLAKAVGLRLIIPS